MKAQVWRNTSSVLEWLESLELGGLVGRIAIRYHVAPGDVQDLVQDTRIALWKLGAEVQVSSAWVIRTATNKVVDHVRSRLRSRLPEQAFAGLASGESHDPDLERLLHTQVAILPKDLRDFYELHYVWGLSERDAARELGRCRASVRWLDHRCRRILVGPPRKSR